MGSETLIQLNRQLRKSRPYIDNVNFCETYQTEHLLEISFTKGRCRNDAKGTCIMCNYGITREDRPISIYLQEMKQILESCTPEIRCLMLCTNGSILDDKQIELELLDGIVTLANSSTIPHIQFEAHYLDVTPHKLKLLQEKMPEKKIIIALGLETANQEYQDKIIMKGIDLHKFDETLSLIKQYGFQIELNLMSGLPFLSTYEQFEDAKQSIMWAFNRKCRPVLFPVNIKPHTLLMEMYRSGHYSPISHWLLLLLLDTLNETQLDEIVIAWYGNRCEDYDLNGIQTIFPSCCPKCQLAIDTFYEAFTKTELGSIRKQLLASILTSGNSTCDCLGKTGKSLSDSSQVGFHKMYESYFEFSKNS